MNRWTSRDLEAFPDDGKRYEIIEGELYISEIPHFNHQLVCSEIAVLLLRWSEPAHLGVAVLAPGIIFDDYNDVAPDVIWISHERLATALKPDGYLHSAPELVVEVLSPGEINERRDRETKLKLYSRRGAMEYWIVNWRARQIEIYRREEAVLKQTRTVYADDTLESPYLPGFHCQVREIFSSIVQ